MDKSHLQWNEQKWNEWFLGQPCAHIGWTGPGGWWDEWNDTAPPGTGFEIRALAAWNWACYLSAREAPHNILFSRMSGEDFFFFETWRPEWGSNPRSSTFQAGSFNHCTRAPVLSHLHVTWGLLFVVYNVNPLDTAWLWLWNELSFEIRSGKKLNIFRK